jgi:hypothetical protein
MGPLVDRQTTEDAAITMCTNIPFVRSVYRMPGFGMRFCFLLGQGEG